MGHQSLFTMAAGGILLTALPILLPVVLVTMGFKAVGARVHIGQVFAAMLLAGTAAGVVHLLEAAIIHGSIAPPLLPGLAAYVVQTLVMAHMTHTTFLRAVLATFFGFLYGLLFLAVLWLILADHRQTPDAANATAACLDGMIPVRSILRGIVA